MKKKNHRRARLKRSSNESDNYSKESSNERHDHRSATVLTDVHRMPQHSDPPEATANGPPTVDTAPAPTAAQRSTQRTEPPVPRDVQRHTERSNGPNEHVQQAPASNPAGETQVPDSVRDVISAPGQSLDPSIQRAMKERMGDSFDDVQIHTGPKAARACEDINARAFTVGNHIAFNHGEYDPSSVDGQHVLVHELAHVRQQTGGAVSMLPQTGELEIDPDDRLEREAEQTAQRVMEGGKLDIQRMEDTDVHVQRTPIDNRPPDNIADTRPLSLAPADATAVDAGRVRIPGISELPEGTLDKAAMSDDVYANDPEEGVLTSDNLQDENGCSRVTGDGLYNLLGIDSNTGTATIVNDHIVVEKDTGIFRANDREHWFPSHFTRSGFKAALYRQEGGYVLAFRGTEGFLSLEGRRDWAANIPQSLSGGGTKHFDQYTLAMDLARYLDERLPSLSFTGHSLGGGLASAGAVVTGNSATTFNAAGLNPKTIQSYLNENRTGQLPVSGGQLSEMDGDEAMSEERLEELITAYYVDEEPLSWLQNVPLLPEATGDRKKIIPPGDTDTGWVGQHGMAYVRKQLEQYKSFRDGPAIDRHGGPAVGPGGSQ